MFYDQLWVCCCSFYYKFSVFIQISLYVCNHSVAFQALNKIPAIRKIQRNLKFLTQRIFSKIKNKLQEIVLPVKTRVLEHQSLPSLVIETPCVLEIKHFYEMILSLAVEQFLLFTCLLSCDMCVILSI